MKIFGAVAMLAAGTGLWAADTRVVTACVNPGADTAMMFRGQATATRILKQAGIQLNWRSEEHTCTEGKGILVTFSKGAPMTQHPGALAFARPFGRTQNIVLFYDRVLNTAGPRVAPALLGYVLAHEIIHMMQGVDLHAVSGVMKARWDSRDYYEMQRGRLNLNEEDIALIDRGLQWRAARAARVE